MRKLSLIIFLSFLSTSLHSQIKAITEKGDTISVFKNGTWEIYNQKPNVLIDEKSSILDTNSSEVELRKIIRIKRFSSDRPNSVGGVGFNIVWKNTSMKTVNYIYFEVAPYNAVGDIVTGRIGGSSFFRGKVTGPFKPDAGDRAYWSGAWYNNTIKKIKIINIEIEYSDGSTILLSENDIKKVIY
jgi:hypothetical protein